MIARLGFAALAATLVMGCQTTPPEQQWTRRDATPEDVKRDLYWCTTLVPDPPRFSGTPAQERRVTRKIDDECMEQRGYTKKAPKS